MEKARLVRWLSYPFHPRKLWSVLKRRSYLTLYRLICPSPDIITERNWHNLIVLDACRFDVFAQLNRIPGKLIKIVSPGSRTEEWLVANFSGKKMDDVVYVSANPYGSNFELSQIFGENPFYKVVEVWRHGWSDKLGTVHPFAVNTAAKVNLRKHPEKRFIIHYIQPHFPFIGKYRVWNVGWSDVRRTVVQKNPERLIPRGYDVWRAFQDGLLDRTSVWRAYISNLELVLSYVGKLLPHLTGTTCITSDHGDVFGKFGVFYSHPGGTPLPELIEVPWFEVE